jgi:hypothetical protein
MPERLFIFIQLEFPWTLGPADGRYLLRAGTDGEPEQVVVLGTLAAARATTDGGASGRLRAIFAGQVDRGPGPPARPEPAPVTTTRVTVIDPISLSAEQQARAWLAELDREREVGAAVTVVNRVLHSHRVAAADPYLREVSPAQALVIRAGWGEGEQVADGRWLHARELSWSPRKRRGLGLLRRPGGERSAALRPQERLAALLGGRTSMLLCEELTLRARLDLDQGRPLHAALELDSAYAAALAELREEGRQDLAIRVAELEQLQAGVSAQAHAARSAHTLNAEGPDEEILEHALGRLEAALRARTATGFTLP